MNNELISWGAKDRAKYIKKLKETTFDVLIVGGGITGAGVLRECGLQGIKAALIEKDDFGFGTSSKSTRLAHGGVRYIINGEFGLVREETHERDWMRGAFPNLVRPVPIVFACYSLKEAIMVGIVLAIYDALSDWKNYRISRFLSIEKIRKLEPDMTFKGIHSGFLLYECITNDARLTAEVVKEGVMLGGMALNYVRAKEVFMENGRAAGVEAIDRETGETFTIKAKNVVNASGPWTDGLLPKDYNEGSRLIRPAKGVHIVVKREAIGNRGGLYVKNPVDKRGVFVLAHGDYTYLGTTDTEYKGDLDNCYTQKEEYEYFKDITNACLPAARFEPGDLVGTYAGNRPLVHQEGLSEDKTSRREYIDEVKPGFFVLTGGKLTIFRTMALKLLNYMSAKDEGSITEPDRKLSKKRFSISLTKDEWDGLIRNTFGDKGPDLDARTLEHIYQNYGRGGLAILEMVRNDPSLAAPIMYDQPDIMAEVDYCLEYEMITHVKDFLLRRTNLSLHQRDNHEELGLRVAERMAAYLGWSELRIEDEVAEYVSLARRNKFFLSDKS
jgi:glycerol-3-phosphate dehydrogenase